MKKLASLEVRALVEELQFLKSAKVSNIYLPNKKEILMVLHKKDKEILRIDADRGVFLVSSKEDQKEANAQCRYLRERLTGLHVADIRQKGFERIIEIQFDNELILIVELFSKGNIMLVEQGVIKWVAQPEDWGFRRLRVKEDYKYPPLKPDLLALSYDDFARLVMESTKENIVKCLAIDFGFGGVYAEEVCKLSGVDKNKKDVDKDEIKKIFYIIHNLKFNPVKVVTNGKITDVLPFVISGLKDYTKIDRMSSGLEEYFNLPDETGYLGDLKRLEEMREIQELQIKQIENDIENDKEIGNHIYANFGLVNSIIDEVNSSRFKTERKEIKKMLPKEKKVIIEI
jgi:predicted ribosome quality control (RQC) complex YloA/Tae2 family protein